MTLWTQNDKSRPGNRLNCMKAIAIAILIWAVAPGSQAFSDNLPKTRQLLPASVTDALSGLLLTVGAQPEERFPAATAETVIEFVENTASDDVIYHTGDDFSAPSAYHRFDLDQDMETFLGLAFSPGIPSYALTPASIRLSKWVTADGAEAPDPDLLDDIESLDAPRQFRGIEYMENTPDTHSGAYYAYYLHRTLALMRHKGRTVLVSMSKQKDVSDTGKKGVVLGNDNNWAYLYSGQNGLSVPGMGWVKSYMYDSYSATIYIQSPDAPGQVRCGVFKWIRAGWSSINMVRPHHIYAGLVRYSDSFSAIINHPRLPSKQQMATVFNRIKGYSTGELRATFERYLEAIENNFGGDENFPQQWFTDWFRSRDYLQRLNADQMRAALSVEYIRQLLGKPHCIDLTKILGMRHRLTG